MKKRGRLKFLRSSFFFLAIFLAILTIQNVKACAVYGEIFNASHDLTVGNATVYCLGGSYSTCYDDDPNDTAYFCDFGGPLVTCSQACPNGINATAINTTLNIWGYNFTSSPDNDNDIGLNITMHEHNAPIVEIASPGNGANFTTTGSNVVDFSLKCYDDSELSVLQLYGMKTTTAGNWSSAWQARATNSSPVNNSWWNFTLVFSDGIYKIGARCNDTSNNIGWSENRTFTVDLNAPSIILNSPDDGHKYEPSGNTYEVTLSWTATDAVSSSLTCRLYVNDELRATQTCTSGSICSNTSSYASSSSGNGAEYEWYVNCSDNFHSNISETRSFFVKKTGGGGGGGGGPTIPTCGDLICNGLTQEFSFTCSVYNFTSLINISLYGNFNGTWQLIETQNVNGTNANVIFTRTLTSGNYLWNCYVCDEVEGCKFTSSQNYTIEVNITGDENCFTCPMDCPCLPGQICDPLLMMCILPCVCGDLICDPNCNETQITCPQDCFAGAICGNGICEPGETQVTCPEDCGQPSTTPGCGDGICSRPEENADTCPQDCQAVCGDKICENGENKENCCQDCGCPLGQKCTKVEEKDENGTIKIKYKCKGLKTWWWILIIVAIAITSYFTYRHYKKLIRKRMFRGLGGFR
ncbi:MAG: hypothetical protein QXP53_00175 [Candidatus Pacearchaeota archaeon]